MSIKLLIGGSPCTYWSVAQKNNRETKAEGQGWELFKNYLIAKEKFKPDFFLYENNKSAAPAIKQQIKEELNVSDGTLFTLDNDARYIEINSALVSAQNRQRFYVHNCGEVPLPCDRNILLKDILENGTRIPEYGNREKSRPVEALYANHSGCGIGSLEKRLFSDNPNKQQNDLVAVPIGICEGNKSCTLKAQYYKNGVANFITNGKYNATGVAEMVGVGVIRDKSRTITAGYTTGSNRDLRMDIESGGYLGKQGVFEKIQQPMQVGALPRPNGELSTSQAMRIYDVEHKSITLQANGGGMGGKTGLYAIPLDNNSLYLSPKMVKYAYKTGTKNYYYKEKIMPKKACPLATKHGYRAGVTNYIPQNLANIKYVLTTDGKSKGATPVYEVKNKKITINNKQYDIDLADGYYVIRKLTVTECERLQTLPDGYAQKDNSVSKTQQYKGLGNGWTAEVIIHILNYALKDVPKDEEIIVLSMYDGIGTGRYCLDKMGFTNVKYYASEIDKYAIKIAQSNYPDIIEIGDAYQVREDDWSLEKIIKNNCIKYDKYSTTCNLLEPCISQIWRRDL